MDGFRSLPAAEGGDQYRHMRVIAMTGYYTPERRRFSQRADVFCVPFSNAEVTRLAV